MKIFSLVKPWQLIISLLFMNATSNAQTKPASIAGDYFLEGVRETASGFQLNEDGSFQFFFSYGALDRYGKGRWTLKDSVVSFESLSTPTHDFRLVQKRPAQTGKTIIQLKNLHPALLQAVYCTVYSGNKKMEGMTNSKGFVSFDLQQVDSIELSLEFCPEKKSVFKPMTQSALQFEFEPEPWLMEVFFKDFRLQLSPNGLSGGHPLSHKTDFHYHKN